MTLWIHVLWIHVLGAKNMIWRFIRKHKGNFSQYQHGRASRMTNNCDLWRKWYFTSTCNASLISNYCQSNSAHGRGAGSAMAPLLEDTQINSFTQHSWAQEHLGKKWMRNLDRTQRQEEEWANGVDGTCVGKKMDGLQMPSYSQRRSSETSKSFWDNVRSELYWSFSDFSLLAIGCLLGYSTEGSMTPASGVGAVFKTESWRCSWKRKCDCCRLLITSFLPKVFISHSWQLTWLCGWPYTWLSRKGSRLG